jgi:hypothetical protein
MTKYALDQYEEMALERWKQHFYECDCLDEDYRPDYQEWLYALESWHECKEVKFVEYNMTLKVKWEHRCWWGDCKTPRNFLGSYSCILLDIKDGQWQEPYDHAKTRNL